MSTVAFSPNGKTLAAGGWDQSVRLLELPGGKQQAKLDFSAHVIQAAFSPDGLHLAVAVKDYNIILYEAGSWRQRLKMEAPHARMAFSADGKRLFTGDNLGRWHIWDVMTGDRVASHQASASSANAVSAIALAPDEKTLATGDDEGTIKIWDVASGLVLLVLDTTAGGEVRGLSYSPDGRYLAAAGPGGRVSIWPSLSP
jgi:WD40 repeat protein